MRCTLFPLAIVVPLGFPGNVFNGAASHVYQKIVYSFSFTRVLSHCVFLSKVLTRHNLKKEMDIQGGVL
jgi:hypothetical protein